MHRQIPESLVFGLTAAMFLACAGSSAVAAPMALDTASASNGIYEIYSVTFDGPVAPCGPTSPSYCSFFQNGPPPSPPAVRALAISPNPTMLINGVPVGFASAPASGSFLDLSLGTGNSAVTLAGGTVKFPDFVITIRDETVVTYWRCRHRIRCRPADSRRELRWTGRIPREPGARHRSGFQHLHLDRNELLRVSLQHPPDRDPRHGQVPAIR